MKLYIGGISPEVTEQDLLDLYSQFGKVTKVDLLKDPSTKINRGYAFVDLSTEDDGESAILGTNNTLMGSANIQVSVSRSRLDQKISRQKSNKSKSNFTSKPKQFRESNNSVNGPRRSNRSRGQFRSGNNSPRPRNEVADPYNLNTNTIPQENNYNRKPYSNSENNREVNYNSRSQHQFKKGQDYGRNNQRPQTSFLGQEGFANSIRTMDPVYNSPLNQKTEGYRRPNENNNNYNNRGRNPQDNRRRNFDNNRRFDRKSKTNSNFNSKPAGNYNTNLNSNQNSTSLYSPNTSDILGNLES